MAGTLGAGHSAWEPPICRYGCAAVKCAVMVRVRRNYTTTCPAVVLNGEVMYQAESLESCLHRSAAETRNCRRQTKHWEFIGSEISRV